MAEAVLTIASDVMPHFMLTMARSPEARALCFAGSDYRTTNVDGDIGSLQIRWNQIKWYKTDEAIDALEDFFDWCDDTGHKNTYTLFFGDRDYRNGSITRRSAMFMYYNSYSMPEF